MALKYSTAFRDYLFPYAGNKDREIPFIIQFLKDSNINLDDYHTVVEGFGGSFAFIRYLVRTGYEKKYTVYDTDAKMIGVYNEMIDEKRNDAMCDKIREYMTDMDKSKYLELVKGESLDGYLLKNVFYQMRPGLFPTRDVRHIPYDRFKKFMKFRCVSFECADFFDVVDKYKDDAGALIFLDPPYFLSVNDYYSTKLTDQFFKLIERQAEYKCRFFGVMNNHILIRSFLKANGVKCIEYNGVYLTSRRESSHLYFTNLGGESTAQKCPDN